MPRRADLVFTNTKTYTADPGRPNAGLVAVRGSKIVHVGSMEEVGDWMGSGSRIVDGSGKSLLPGFIDSHFHLLLGSVSLRDVQLYSMHSLNALSNAVSAHAAENPAREWLAGHGLPYNILPNAESLTRHHLDAISPDRPLIVFAYDAHTAWANTAALKRASILHGGTVGPNSEIVMGADGLATGELREPGAYRHVQDLIPAPDAVETERLVKLGLAQAAQQGITSVHNMDGSAEQIALYARLDDLGKLTLRIYLPFSVTPETEPAELDEALRWKEEYQTDLLRAGSAKFFMDGVIESYTALMLDDYAGAPGNHGDANYSAEHFARMATEADRRGLQILVHAIGDAAVRRTLDGFAAAQKANGKRDSRHRVEHIEVIHPDDLPRFAELGVVASMQPLHAPPVANGADIWPSRVGPERWPHSFAWQYLRERHTPLVFGSDWPVVAQDVLAGIQRAVTRQPWAPALPSHRQTLTDTLDSYTRVAAYAEFQENVKGQIKAGLAADLVLLSEDIFSIPPEEIGAAKPVMTVCNGRIVYET